MITQLLSLWGIVGFFGEVAALAMLIAAHRDDAVARKRSAQAVLLMPLWPIGAVLLIIIGLQRLIRVAFPARFLDDKPYESIDGEDSAQLARNQRAGQIADLVADTSRPIEDVIADAEHRAEQEPR